MNNDPELQNLLQRARMLKQNRLGNNLQLSTPNTPVFCKDSDESSSSQIKILTNQVLQQKRENILLSDDFKLIKAKYMQQLKDNNVLNKQLANLQSEKDTLQLQYNQSQQLVIQQQQQISSQNDKISQLQDVHNQDLKDIQNVKDQLLNEQNDNLHRKQQCNVLENEKVDLQLLIEKLQAEQKVCLQDNKAIKEQLEAFKLQAHFPEKDLILSRPDEQFKNQEIESLKSEISALQSQLDISKSREQSQDESKNIKMEILSVKLQYQDLQVKYLNLLIQHQAPSDSLAEIASAQSQIAQELRVLQQQLKDVGEPDRGALIGQKNAQINELTAQLAVNNDIIKQQLDQIQESHEKIQQYDEKLFECTSKSEALVDQQQAILSDNQQLAAECKRLKSENQLIACQLDDYNQLFTLLRSNAQLSSLVVQDSVNMHALADLLCAFSGADIQSIHDNITEVKAALAELQGIKPVCLDAICAEITQKMQSFSDVFCGREEENIALQSQLKQQKSIIQQLMNINIIRGLFTSQPFDAGVLKQELDGLENRLRELENVQQLAQQYQCQYEALELQYSSLRQENAGYNDQMKKVSILESANGQLESKLLEIKQDMQQLQVSDDYKQKTAQVIQQQKEQISGLAGELQQWQQKYQTIAAQAHKLQDIIEHSLTIDKQYQTEYPFSEILQENGVNGERPHSFQQLHIKHSAIINQQQSDLAELQLQLQRYQSLSEESQIAQAQCQEVMAGLKLENTHMKSQLAELLSRDVEKTVENLTAQLNDLSKQNSEYQQKQNEMRQFCDELQSQLATNFMLPNTFLRYQLFKDSMRNGQLDIKLLEVNIQQARAASEQFLDAKFVAEEYKAQIREYQELIRGQRQQYEQTAQENKLLSAQLLDCCRQKESQAPRGEDTEFLQLERQGELLRAKDEQILQQQQQLLNSTQQVAQLGEQLSSLTQQNGQLRAELASLAKKSSQYDAVVDRFKDQLKANGETDVASQIEQLQQENTRLASRNGQLEVVQAELQQSLERLAEGSRQAQITSDGAALQQQKYQQLQLDHDALRQELRLAMAGTTELRQQIDTAAKFQSQLFAIFDVSSESEAILQAELAKDQLDKLQHAFQTLELENDRVKAENEQKNEQINALKGQTESYQAQISEYSGRFAQLNIRIEQLQQAESAGEQAAPHDHLREQLTACQQELYAAKNTLKQLTKGSFMLPKRLLSIYPFEKCCSNGALDVGALEQTLQSDNEQLLQRLQEAQSYMSENARCKAEVLRQKQQIVELRQVLQQFDEILGKNQVISKDLLQSAVFSGCYDAAGQFDASQFARLVKRLEALQAKNAELQELVDLQNRKQEADLEFSKSAISTNQLKLSTLERENNNLRRSSVRKSVGQSVQLASTSAELAQDELVQKRQ